jgi:hypothetical protein
MDVGAAIIEVPAVKVTSTQELRSAACRGRSLALSSRTNTMNRHGHFWFLEEERRLYDGFIAGEPLDSLAQTFGRRESSLVKRLRKLGVIDEDGNRVQPIPDFAPRSRREESASARAASLVSSTKTIRRAPKRKTTAPTARTFSLPPLPIESPYEWPQHGCLPLATWFVAHVAEALREHVEESARRSLLLHLGWGTRKPPLYREQVSSLFGGDYKEANRAIGGATNRLTELISENHQGLLAAQRVARTMLLLDGAVDRQRLVLLADGMYGANALAAAGLLWLLAEPNLDFFTACRRVMNQRKRMLDGRGKPNQARRAARRWALLWLGAWLPRRLRVTTDLSELSSGPVRMPSLESVGTVGSFESRKNGRVVHFESREEQRILALLEEHDEVAAFSEQPLLIERGDAEYGYCPDVAVVTREKLAALIEVKPEVNMTSEAVLRKTLAALQFAASFGCAYMMVDRTGRKLLDLFAHDVPSHLRSAILQELEGRASLSHRECEPYFGDTPEAMDWRTMSALAVQADLSFSCYPHFRVSRLSEGLRWTELVRVAPQLMHGVGVREDGIDSLFRRYR